MICLDCLSLNLRKVTRQQSAANTGYCDAQERYAFISMERECDSYQAAPADQIEKRVVWLRKNK